MAASGAIFWSSGEVKIIVPEDEVELAEKTTSAEIIAYRPGGLHTLEGLASLFRKPLGAALEGKRKKARIGAQSAQGVQPATYAVSTDFRSSLVNLLAELLPEASLASCDDLLESMKTVKTTKGLEIIHAACRAPAAGFAEASKRIEPGRRENDVAADARTAFEKTHDAHTEQCSYGYDFCRSGPNSATAAAAYGRIRQRVVEKDDLEMIHANTFAGGVLDTYHANLRGRRVRLHCLVFDRMLKAEAVTVVQADATRCGGIGFLNAGTLCWAANIPLSSHCGRACMPMYAVQSNELSIWSSFTTMSASSVRFSMDSVSRSMA
jgi:hypothetical protein